MYSCIYVSQLSYAKKEEADLVNYLATMIERGSIDRALQILQSWQATLSKDKELSSLQTRQLQRAFTAALAENESAIVTYILQHFPLSSVIGSEKKEKEQIIASLQRNKFDFANMILDGWLFAHNLSNYQIEGFPDILQVTGSVLESDLKKLDQLKRALAAKPTSKHAYERKKHITEQENLVTAYREIIFRILGRLTTRIVNITKALRQLKTQGTELTQKEIYQHRSDLVTAHSMVDVLRGIMHVDTNNDARQTYQEALGVYSTFITLLHQFAPKLTEGNLLDLIKSGNDKAAQELLYAWKIMNKKLSSNDIEQLPRAYITALGMGHIELVRLLLEHFSKYIITPSIIPHIDHIFKQEKLEEKEALALFYSLKQFFSVLNYRNLFLLAIDKDFLKLAFLIASEGKIRFEPSEGRTGFEPFVGLLISNLIDAIKRGNVTRATNILHVFTELNTRIDAHRLNQALQGAPAQARQQLQKAVTAFLDPSSYEPFITLPLLAELPDLSQPILSLIATALITYLRSQRAPHKPSY